MAERGAKQLESDGRVEIREGDALDIEFEPCDLIVSYYTMQFVRPARRQELVRQDLRAPSTGAALS